MRIGAGWSEVTLSRYVEEVCPRCHGYGQRSYANTATWRGGMGGQAITQDVCDVCWGTGDRANPGYNIREWESRRAEDVSRRARCLLDESMGAGIGILGPAQLVLAEYLEKLARKRTTDRETEALARILSRRLRELSALGRDYRDTPSPRALPVADAPASAADPRSGEESQCETRTTRPHTTNPAELGCETNVQLSADDSGRRT